jgi:hypothetical protein
MVPKLYSEVIIEKNKILNDCIKQISLRQSWHSHDWNRGVLEDAHSSNYEVICMWASIWSMTI